MKLFSLLRDQPGLLGQGSCLGPQPQPQPVPLAPINLPFSRTSANLGACMALGVKLLQNIWSVGVRQPHLDGRGGEKGEKGRKMEEEWG